MWPQRDSIQVKPANSALGYKIALIRLALQKSHSRSQAMLPFAASAANAILPSMPEYSPPSCYSELEESGFHSDEEMQKVGDVCECLVNVWGGPLSVFTGRRYLTVYTFARAVRLWRSRPAWENAPLNCCEFPNSLYLSPLSFRPATR